MDDPILISDESNNHLTTETLTSYINYFDRLSQYEVDHITAHLDKCSDCENKYTEVFDRLLNESKNKHSLSLFNNNISLSESDEVLFEDISNNFRLTIFKNSSDDYILIFNLIPHSVHNNMIRITVHELDKTFRFLNIDVRKEYKVGLPSETLINSITEIEVDILITTSRTTYPKKIEYRFNLITSIALLVICGVLISALIYFFSSDKDDNNEVVLMTHTRKEMIESEKDRPHESESEMAAQKFDPGLPAEFDSTSIADSIFNIKPEDVNVRNEFSPNYILERNINMVDSTGKVIVIISPKMNDTLYNSIKLSWMDTETNNAYTINIVDNKNRTMYQTTVRGSDLIYSGKLKPGLYYWNIIVNNRLKQSSKFYVK